jgi:hypothetical protein
VVAVVLSACAKAPVKDEGSPPGDSLPALLSALEKTNDARSARMAVDLTFTSSEQTVRVTGDVEYVRDLDDPTSFRERMLLDIPSMGMMPGGTIEVIVAKGPVIYVRAPMLASFMPAATPWLKLDPSELPSGQGGLEGAAAAVDPTLILAAIKDALTVEEVGADTVGGADTTHYRATIDLMKLLPLIAAISGEEPSAAELQEAKDQLTKVGLETLPVGFWVGDSGYLAQAQLALDLSALDPGDAGASLSLTLTFSDFGEHVSIVVPPASQVTDISRLFPSGFPTTTTA